MIFSYKNLETATFTRGINAWSFDTTQNPIKTIIKNDGQDPPSP